MRDACVTLCDQRCAKSLPVLWPTVPSATRCCTTPCLSQLLAAATHTLRSPPHARDTFASGLAKVLLRRQVGQCARIFLQLVPLFLVFLIHLAVRSKIAMSAHTRVCARAQPQLHVNAMCPGWCKSDMAGNHASSLASADRTRFNAIVCAGWERPPKTAAEGADTVRALQLHQRVYCWRWP